MRALCIQNYPNRVCSGCTSGCDPIATPNVTVRDWQTDSAHDLKMDGVHLRGTGANYWNVPSGVTVDNDRGHTVAWAVRMVLSCQRARATEAC
jgi:hypothetical protein